MDPWQDFPKFTDAALAAFIKGHPSHPDHATAVAEFKRRRREREQRSGTRSHQTEVIPASKGFLIWTTVGFAILAIALLSLASPILTRRDSPVGRPPTDPSVITTIAHTLTTAARQ